jgi:hypothetical protein
LLLLDQYLSFLKKKPNELLLLSKCVALSSNPTAEKGRKGGKEKEGRKIDLTWVWWWTPVISTIEKAEVRGSQPNTSPRKVSRDTI